MRWCSLETNSEWLNARGNERTFRWWHLSFAILGDSVAARHHTNQWATLSVSRRIIIFATFNAHGIEHAHIICCAVFWAECRRSISSNAKKVTTLKICHILVETEGNKHGQSPLTSTPLFSFVFFKRLLSIRDMCNGQTTRNLLINMIWTAGADGWCE